MLRSSVTTIAVAVALVGAGSGISGAMEAPYTPTPTTTISTSNPPIGGKVRLAGKNWAPRESLVISIHSKKKVLKVVKTTKAGTYATTVQLPKKYKCEHTIKVKGKKSGQVTKTPITIGKLSKC